MENNKGLTLETAIILTNVGSPAAGSHQIYKIVDEMFGNNDGDYFVHSEKTLENKQLDKKYKILFIEDYTGVKRSVWFDITEWS